MAFPTTPLLEGFSRITEKKSPTRCLRSAWLKKYPKKTINKTRKEVLESEPNTVVKEEETISVCEILTTLDSVRQEMKREKKSSLTSETLYLSNPYENTHGISSLKRHLTGRIVQDWRRFVLQKPLNVNAKLMVKHSFPKTSQEISITDTSEISKNQKQAIEPSVFKVSFPEEHESHQVKCTGNIHSKNISSGTYKGNIKLQSENCTNAAYMGLKGEFWTFTTNNQQAACNEGYESKKKHTACLDNNKNKITSGIVMRSESDEVNGKLTEESHPSDSDVKKNEENIEERVCDQFTYTTRLHEGEDAAFVISSVKGSSFDPSDQLNNQLFSNSIVKEMKVDGVQHYNSNKIMSDSDFMRILHGQHGLKHRSNWKNKQNAVNHTNKLEVKCSTGNPSDGTTSQDAATVTPLLKNKPLSKRPIVNYSQPTNLENICGRKDAFALYSKRAMKLSSNETDAALNKKEYESSLEKYWKWKSHQSQTFSIYSKQHSDVKSWMSFLSQKKSAQEISREKKIQKVQRRLQYANNKSVDRLKRIGPHLEVYEAFHPVKKNPSIKTIVNATICIQKFVRGWLLRTRLNKIKTKAEMHGPSFVEVVKKYRQMMNRIQRRFGVKKPTTALVYSELEEWLDKKTSK
ncbi:uncharacterized protein LOC115092544 [Rhinatrema bivittatum]|uniref:uncharacterized protein LOC115092544 n=1 Tax=Rhinatrema bivittatum TaxID=194408 RepID=UPI0011295FDC|nr:uncharacterized protein LOC115092544 [Rhinatrema bivittatum]